MDINQLTDNIIGAAIEVHRELGPGLLESIYEQSLARELALRKIPFERQKLIPLCYKGERIESDFRLDLLVAGQVIVEIKSVQSLLPVHDAQVLSYLKLSGLKLGLLINFNVKSLRFGIRRKVLNLDEKYSLRSPRTPR